MAKSPLSCLKVRVPAQTFSALGTVEILLRRKPCSPKMTLRPAVRFLLLAWELWSSDSCQLFLLQHLQTEQKGETLF